MSSKKVVRVPGGLPPLPFLSYAIRAGDFIFVSGYAGLVPGHPSQRDASRWTPGKLVEGGIEAETRQTLENIKMALEAAGASLQDIVKVNAFLSDIDRDFAVYNKVYLEYFQSEPPARTTVGARIYGNILVEIDCIAYLPRERTGLPTS